VSCATCALLVPWSSGVVDAGVFLSPPSLVFLARAVSYERVALKVVSQHCGGWNVSWPLRRFYSR